jgi:hypothetical protein
MPARGLKDIAEIAQLCRRRKCGDAGRAIAAKGSDGARRAVKSYMDQNYQVRP